MPKLEPSGNKGTFVGYRKSSKVYRIYIPGSRQIEVNQDVIFEEEMAIRKGRGSDMEIDDDEEMRPSPLQKLRGSLKKGMNRLVPLIPLIQMMLPNIW